MSNFDEISLTHG